MGRKNKFVSSTDIANAVAKKCNITLAEAENIVDNYFEQIKTHLLSGEQVRLAGFGTFEIKKWNSSTLYDVNNKVKIERDIKTVSFKDSSVLKKEVIG